MIRKIFGVILLATAGCTSNPPARVLQPVGPARLVAAHAPGFLIVSTEIEAPGINADTLFYPHKGYAIYDNRGAFLRTVRNHLGPWDETPERVSLRPGNYTVAEETQFGSDFLVPVIIRQGETTRVDLERSGLRTADR